MTVLVTGCAGFIGSHLVERLLKGKARVLGIDNFNDYYDPSIKKRNIKVAQKNRKFKLIVGDILDTNLLNGVFKQNRIDVVVHLAARAGVRPSIIDPVLYSDINKIGTLNLLRLSAKYKVKKFIFASSSSVYGQSQSIPFREDDPCASILSPYGASKRAAEFFVETYSKIFGLRSIILRFFTVYGPRGRPDMAPSLFSHAILRGVPVVQFGDGLTYRDYTYIDDIITGIIKSIDLDTNFEIINLGNNNPVPLAEFIKTIEEIAGKKANVRKVPIPAGDVEKTWADINRANRILNWQPNIKIREGLKIYIQWLKNVS